jgi:membrane protein implicated in regulation of membrane protease activity
VGLVRALRALDLDDWLLLVGFACLSVGLLLWLGAGPALALVGALLIARTALAVVYARQAPETQPEGRTD